jgi:hypothetical protein
MLDGIRPFCPYLTPNSLTQLYRNLFLPPDPERIGSPGEPFSMARMARRAIAVANS